MTSQKLFLQQFKENFFHMGAILPSSKAAAQSMVSYLAKKQGPVHVLEAGAGTGAFTSHILAHLKAGDKLDIVEINPELMNTLKQHFTKNPAFKTEGVTINFINDDIRHIPAHNRYDYIIFSLPLTNFPPTLVEEILNQMMHQLKPGGVFSYIKYIFIGRIKYLFSNTRVKAEMKTNQAIINRFTTQYQIKRRPVIANVPPAWTYFWRKTNNKGQLTHDN